MKGPRQIRVQPCFATASGLDDASTIRVRCWRKKRRGADELVEIVFVNVTDGQLRCVRGTITTRLKEVRDYFARRWNQLVQEVGKE